MNAAAAITFVRSTGNAVEQARLRYALEGNVPPPDVRWQVFAGQREAGGWSPFWAADYSSLDAPYFRLAQAEQVGLTAADAAVQRALALLAHRQRLDGSWEEDAALVERAPHWIAPGELAARLHLSANCGYWLATWADASEHARRAANYLRGYLEHDRDMPGFRHTLSLSGGGVWYRLGHRADAERAFSALARRLGDLPASSLAWLLSTLLLAGAPSDHPLVEQAAVRLELLQEPDGRWSSEDGPTRDVHTTVEALRALTLCRHG
jgi:hypothetical protein